jgi:hypothetical protein
MWIKLSEEKPKKSDAYFVSSKNTKVPFILDYDKIRDLFGNGFPDGTWQTYHDEIEYWQAVKYPMKPNTKELHQITWEKDKDDPEGKKYRYYDKVSIVKTK